jgi:hypothetical protein
MSGALQSLHHPSLLVIKSMLPSGWLCPPLLSASDSVWQLVNKEQVSWVLPPCETEQKLAEEKIDIYDMMANLAVDIVVAYKNEHWSARVVSQELDDVLLAKLHPPTEVHIALHSVRKSASVQRTTGNDLTSRGVNKTISHVVPGLSGTSQV